MSYSQFFSSFTRKLTGCKPLVIVLLLFATSSGKAGGFLTASDSVHTGRRNLVLATTSGFSVGLLGVLSHSWYANYNTGSFHFFNDELEWRGMDKIGHAVTAYQSAFYVANFYRWAGIAESKAIHYGAWSSFAFLTGVEVFDGFSEGWGFSWADMASNTLGVAALYLNREDILGRSFNLKYSYFPSQFRELRPSLLGQNEVSALIKDYNAQSYWLSVNISSCLKSSKLPSWLNLAFGYGVDGLIGGANNPLFDNEGNAYPLIHRSSSFYFSPDIEWRNIPTKHPFWRAVFTALSFYKMPFPALGYNTLRGAEFHWLK